MKKPFDYKELSNKRCCGCGRKLKKNLVAKNPDATRCYKCDDEIKRAKRQSKNDR